MDAQLRSILIIIRGCYVSNGIHAPDGSGQISGSGIVPLASQGVILSVHSMSGTDGLKVSSFKTHQIFSWIHNRLSGLPSRITGFFDRPDNALDVVHVISYFDFDEMLRQRPCN